jgi:hypothetical protein
MEREHLHTIFQNLRSLMSKYEKDLRIISDAPSRYEVEFDREFETKSLKTGNILKKKGLYFTGLIIQKDYVGLYFMPIYSHKDEFQDLSPDFMKRLKGKSCFHIKTWDRETERETKKLFKKGFSIYKDLYTFKDRKS